MLDAHVARTADDQGFAMARSHPPGPVGHICPPLSSEILLGSNVMYLSVFL